MKLIFALDIPAMVSLKNVDPIISMTTTAAILILTFNLRSLLGSFIVMLREMYYIGSGNSVHIG